MLVAGSGLRFLAFRGSEQEHHSTWSGGVLDEEYTQRITAEDLMPAPEKAGEPLHVYAKFSIRSFTDTSNTATIDTSGALIYGGGDDYLYVRNLDDADGLIYTYEWNVTFNDKPFTGSEKQYDLFGAGEYAVSVNVTANYKNGVLV